MTAALAIAVLLLWCWGAALVLQPLLGPAVRQLAAESRALARRLRRTLRR
ncbi:hypothetical protein ACFQ9X_56505 [Catenulispora yoronensis]